MRTADRAVALIGLVLGIAATELGILIYQAWWTIVFAVAGVAVMYVAPRHRAAAIVALGAAVAFFLALGMLGIFAVVMGLSAGGAACQPDVCSYRGPGIVFGGVIAILVSIVGLGFTLRYARRSSMPSKVEPSTK